MGAVLRPMQWYMQGMSEVQRRRGRIEVGWGGGRVVVSIDDGLRCAQATRAACWLDMQRSRRQRRSCPTDRASRIGIGNAYCSSRSSSWPVAGCMGLGKYGRLLLLVSSSYFC